MGTHPIFESDFDCLTADMAAPVRLRCKYEQGQKPIPNVTSSTTIADLQAIIETLSGVPVPSQSIRFGYPPKKMDLTRKESTIGECGLRSGETLIVEGKSLESWPAVVPQQLDETKTTQKNDTTVIEPGIRRKEVP